jgi:alanine racemase
MSAMHPDLIAEISAGAIRRNLSRVRSRCGPEPRICVVLKANAYGHGTQAVLRALATEDVVMAAVASLDEAVELRDLGWSRDILCMGAVLGGIGATHAGERGERLASIVEHDLTVSVADLIDMVDLDAAAARRNRRVKVQVNVETGMGRLGILPDEALTLARAIQACDHLELSGVYTHLSVAEVAGHPHTARQLSGFGAWREQLADAGVCHAANSSAALGRPEARLDMVRVGLAAYGYRLEGDPPLPEPLEPCLRLRSRIAMTKYLPAGHSVGYGCTYVTKRPTRVGIVPIGYSDGYRRSLSNRAVMGLASATGGPQADAPVIGQVSMDSAAIDLTGVPGAKIGDDVVVIDNRPPRPNSVEALARLMNTIPYEVTCQLGGRVARVPVDEFPPIERT